MADRADARQGESVLPSLPNELYSRIFEFLSLSYNVMCDSASVKSPIQIADDEDFQDLTDVKIWKSDYSCYHYNNGDARELLAGAELDLEAPHV